MFVLDNPTLPSSKTPDPKVLIGIEKEYFENGKNQLKNVYC